MLIHLELPVPAKALPFEEALPVVPLPNQDIAAGVRVSEMGMWRVNRCETELDRLAWSRALG